MAEDKAVDILTIFHLNSSVEHDTLESKEASVGLPRNIWDTYSAFANTDGGVILLGSRKSQRGNSQLLGYRILRRW